MQGGLSHINAIHQESNSPLADQQQFHSLYVRVHASSTRIHGLVIWLGANLDLQHPDRDQYLISFGSSGLFSVFRCALWFSAATMPALANFVSEIKTSVLISLWLTSRMIHDNHGDFTGVKPRLAGCFPLALSRPITEEQCHGSLTCEDSRSEDRGDAGRRKRRLRLGR